MGEAALQRTPPAILPGPNEACWCGSGNKYKKCHRSLDAVEARKRGVTVRRLKPGRISPRRMVPPEIPRPDYAETGKPTRLPPVSEVKSPDVIERMRRACRAAAQVLQVTGAAVRPGVTTDALDALAHAEYIRRGGYPSTLNYHAYPKSICTSVNEVICHGIPDDRPLEEGDIVNVDVTIFLEGVHGDCSATFLVGAVEEESQRLVRVTRECMDKGIEAVRPGRPINDIGKAIEAHAKAHGLGVVRAYCGHGIGERFHSSLQIPHYDEPEATTVMEPGMTFTVEPMITLGHWHHKVWEDQWTAVTVDGSRSAQFEHTVLVTQTGVEILTLP